MNSLLVRSRGESGSAFVEMAVALPVLVAILIGTADFARVFYYAMELTTAARAGAQYGAYNSVTVTQIPEIKAAAQSAAPNISLSSADVTVTTLCQCAIDDGTGQPWATVVCTTTCPAGRHLVQTVKVQTSKTFTIISRFLPIPRLVPLNRSATMRIAL